MLKHASFNDSSSKARHAAIPQLLSKYSATLKAAGIDSAEVEIELVLCHLLDVDRLNLYLHGDELINDNIINKLENIVSQRCTRYPLQYIINESWFYGRKFYVNEEVMVPTPETELLCNSAIGMIRESRLSKPRILDLGTGSGVIAITLAGELEQAAIVATDVSNGAINVAQKNANANSVDSHIEFRHSDFFDKIPESEKFDLILSNPPYICEGDYSGLPPEVKADPKIALTAGPDGLDAIKIILRDAPNFLAGKGRIMFEIGYNQSNDVAELTETDKRYKSIGILKDLNDIDRIAILACDS